MACNTDELDGEQPNECPQCGGTVYREPRLTGGTEKQHRNGSLAGYACQDCTWSEDSPQTAAIQDGTTECPGCGDEADRSHVATYGKCHDCMLHQHRDAAGSQ
jgi:NAD-dependent SIR2 family protein deacetylase